MLIFTQVIIRPEMNPISPSSSWNIKFPREQQRVYKNGASNENDAPLSIQPEPINQTKKGENYA